MTSQSTVAPATATRADVSLRASRRALAAVVILVIVLACISTVWDIEQDRRSILDTTSNLTGSLSESMEGHIDAALRDASNAALSVALLIEKNGGLASYSDEKLLHNELKRELWDESSTVRLVVTDAGGKPLASSSSYPVNKAVAATAPQARWRALAPALRPFVIGLPERSPFGGELVLPFVCDIQDNLGAVVGKVRAEIRISYFTRLYQSITSLTQGAVVVMSNDGVTLMRAPLVERYLGQRGEDVDHFLGRAVGQKGHLEYAPARDGVTRYYAWRKMENYPLIVAVGLDKEAVLKPWRARALARCVVVGLACLGLAGLAVLLAQYLGKLAASQRKLAETELNYWNAMQSSTIAVMVGAIPGRFVQANPTACTLFGYTEAELLALDPELLNAPESPSMRLEVLRALGSGEATSIGHEKCLMHKDGRRIWADVQYSTMHDSEGRPTRLICHIQDITRRKEAEQALRDLNAELEQRIAQRTLELSRANQDLEAFSYSAAHDLRGPLTTLGGFIELVVRDIGAVPDKVQRRLDTIRRQVKQLTSLIDDLLALSRTSRSTLRSVPVNMNTLIAELREQLEFQTAERIVQWHVDPLPDVRADRGLLRDALANLLGNAVKYSGKRDVAVIEVRLAPSADPAFVKFFIRDNGAGFDMDYAADLFLPFKRLHSSSEFEGSGIGLATVKRIIERNGGEITGEGKPGQGATFHVTLPAAGGQDGAAGLAHVT